MPPPHSILKLNFISNYQHSLRKGAIGGVIRDSSGNVVWRFSGSVEVLDENEAEMLALLVASQEVLNLLVFWQLFKEILSQLSSGV